MSRKYIRQEILQDFVYPNNDVPQYDVNGIVHQINNNSVDGDVISFSATTFTSTGLTITYNITWNLNNAEPWIRNSNALGIASIHMLAPGQDYYKPWRVVSSVFANNINASTFTITFNAPIFPSTVGLTTFTSGIYNFEVRFIGHRSIYPVCVSLDLTLPAPPTPTPTITPTPTVTPTATPTGPEPTPTPTATATPTPTPTPEPTFEIFTHGVVFATCSDFCTDNYLIGTTTSASDDYVGLTNGGFIFGQGGVAGFVAYSDVSTDTNTGPFKIAEIDSSGEILGVFVCSGGSCIPL